MFNLVVTYILLCIALMLVFFKLKMIFKFFKKKENVLGLVYILSSMTIAAVAVMFLSEAP